MIYVDADACPVRAEVERVADRHGQPVAVVSNGGIRPSRNPLVTTVIVSEEADAADDWIAQRAGAGDIVITADIPLSARVIANDAKVVDPRGQEIDPDRIGSLLAGRDLMQSLRDATPLGHFGGPSGFTPRHRSQFLDALERVVRKTKAGAA